MKYFIRCKAWSSVKTEQGMIDLVALIKQYSCSGIDATDVRLSITETDTTNVELSLVELYTLFNSSNAILTPLVLSVEAINTQLENLDLEDLANLGADPYVHQSEINEYFKGKYTTLANLQVAFPTANDGEYAIVDAGAGEDALEYIWDIDEGWVPGSSLGATTTDALPEGTSNLYFQGARVLSTILNGISFLVGTPITSTDSILVALGKLQKQITDIPPPDLQQVTDIGSTTDKSININAFGGSTLLASTIVQLSNSSGKLVSISPTGINLITNNNSTFGSIRSDNLSGGSKLFQLPNVSGTLALTSDIPASTVSQTVTNGVTTNSPSEDAVFDAINTNNHWTKTGNDIQNNNTGFIGIGTSPRTKFEIKTADNVFFQFLNSGTRAFLQLVNNPGTGAIPLDINASEIDLKIGTTSALLIENSKVSLKQPSEIFSLSSTEAVPLTITNTSFTANQLVAMDLKNAGVVTSSLKSKVYSSLLGGDFQIFNRNVAGTGTNQVLLIDAYGLATLPLVTNALITADSTGKALITKEYLDVANYWTKTGNDIKNNNTGFVGVGVTLPSNFSAQFRVENNIEVGDLIGAARFVTSSSGGGAGMFTSGYGLGGSEGLHFRTGGNNSQLSYSSYDFSQSFISGQPGIENTVGIRPNVSPVSGSRVLNVLGIVPTINQTGGANGITRGLYINPTLTSAFDFRAIEVTAGKSIFTKTTVKDGLVINNTDTNTGYNNAGIYINNSGYQGIYIDSNNGNAISVGTIGTSDGIKFFGNGSGTILNINTEGGTQTGDMAKFRINGVDITRITKDGKLTTTVPIKLASYTVATLPTGVEGDTAYVTDATAPTYLGTLTGGGTVKCPVFFNGTSWVSC